MGQNRPEGLYSAGLLSQGSMARLQFFQVPPEGKLRSRTGPGGPARGALPLAALPLPE